MDVYRNIFCLEGKTAIVTGAAGLLGREMAKGLAAFGSRVVVADINVPECKKVAETIRHGVQAEPLDITDKASVSRLLARHDIIDVWINSAYPRTDNWGVKLEDVEFESWRVNVDMHLNGYFLCNQQVALKMKEQRSGSIINFASIYGMVGPDFSIYEGTEMTMPAAYAAIKGAIINLTRYLATYLAPYNVRVNCISPGGVFANQPEAFVQAYAQRTPLGRMAKPNEIVGTAVFLASEASSYITGQNLVVDGGWTAW